MTANGGDLTYKQRRAIAALLSSSTVTAAATAAGVGERTLRRWLTEDENFVAGLREAQDRALDEAVSLLAGKARDAVVTLDEIATRQGEAPAARVAASRAMLTFVLRLKEQRDIAVRLAALEELFNDLKQEQERQAQES